MGYVYIVGSDDFKRLKVGYWKGTVSRLKQRYVTCYGKDLILKTYTTDCPELLEKVFFTHFAEKCICCELFKVEYKEDYMKFLEIHSCKSARELEEEHGNLMLKTSKKKRDKSYIEIEDLLKKNDLSFVLNEGYMLKDYKEEMYKALIRLTSKDIDKLLGTIRVHKDLKLRTKMDINGTLCSLKVIREYLDRLGCMREFIEKRKIDITRGEKRRCANEVVELTHGDYLTALKYTQDTKINKVEDIRGYYTINNIIKKVLNCSSIKLEGNKKENNNIRVVISVA